MADPHHEAIVDAVLHKTPTPDRLQATSLVARVAPFLLATVDALPHVRARVPTAMRTGAAIVTASPRVAAESISEQSGLDLANALELLMVVFGEFALGLTGKAEQELLDRARDDWSAFFDPARAQETPARPLGAAAQPAQLHTLASGRPIELDSATSLAAGRTGGTRGLADYDGGHRRTLADPGPDDRDDPSSVP